MKFGIDSGHNCPPDTGAKGIQLEDNLTLDLGNRVIAKLKALGHEAISCKPSKADTVRESLAKRCDTANAANVDIFVSIHFNAFNGQANGTEVFAISETAKNIANYVLNEIVKLGFSNRGVKSGNHLFVLKNTKMPAILVEGCFIDSQKDMNLYNAEAMANAIVKGLTT
jgi:N-acetylmuramoyl-L-alanine amidase